MAIPNRLINETSPYLLQHVHNPVDWHPWDDAAFDEAKEADKPIFLSIGYSTCHWCHVMAHESFENDEVARLMNDTFVNIKVDREERPDIDKLYMTVCQVMTGSGGWPLTIIMTPDRVPFFAATYLPREQRFGRMGMVELIPRIAGLWKDRRHDVDRAADRILVALRNMENETGRAEPEKTILDAAYRQLDRLYDESAGGFGSSPKFPTAQHLLFLLRYWKRTGADRALAMVEGTLKAMRRGGIYDHLGLGFHRYSVDSHWRVPHFEKMLYDQAMLAMAYLEAFHATGKGDYAATAGEIIDYVLTDLTSPVGGFYAAEDADSEGKEGTFYLWTDEEIGTVLDPEEAALCRTVYNIDARGNFADERDGQKTAENILYMTESRSETARRLSLPEEELATKMEAIRRKLRAARSGRIRPHRDDKILTDWNGMMIAALARASVILDNRSYLEAAEGAARFILHTLQDGRGRLLHRYGAETAGIDALLDDYAFLVWGLTELFQATFETEYLEAALRLTDDMITHFRDRKRGGFYFTAQDADSLIVRQKDAAEGAIPSGNSVALFNLIRLGLLTGNSTYMEQATLLGSAFYEEIRKAPVAYTHFLSALDLAFGPSYTIVVAGKEGSKESREMLRTIEGTYLPHTLLTFRPTDTAAPAVTGLAPFTKELTGLEGKTTAYICDGQSCRLPATDIAEIMHFFDDSAG